MPPFRFISFLSCAAFLLPKALIANPETLFPTERIMAKSTSKSTSKKSNTKKAAETKARAQKKGPSAAAAKTQKPSGAASDQDILSSNPDFDVEQLSKFLQKQYARLLQLRDSQVDTMAGVAHDNLRKHAEDTESHAFGQHQADAGSDAYDRDFALNLLSQEQDALYEIDEAISRIKAGAYGVCEMSNKKIPKARLEAIPWARFTVECQSQIEQENKFARGFRHTSSLFGLTDQGGRSSSSD